METILGIKGKDFVMLAADCTQAHSIISLKEGILNLYNLHANRTIFIEETIA